MSESSTDVLLVVSTLGHAEEATEYAIDRTAHLGEGTLHLLLLCEGDSEELANKLSEQSWMGDRVGSEVSQALSKDRRTRGYRVLSGIAHAAEEEDVPTLTEVIEGELDEAIQRYVRAHPVAEIVVSLPAPGPLARFFGSKKDPTERLERAGDAPVKVFHYS
ncbi:MAG: hypothetical protein KDH09_03875 [Chrysiogenetes bacterium]|nr:hypothetical protein [Chrysiogenetes bacterium]